MAAALEEPVALKAAMEAAQHAAEGAEGTEGVVDAREAARAAAAAPADEEACPTGMHLKAAMSYPMGKHIPLAARFSVL